jgi:hypothetical protein
MLSNLKYEAFKGIVHNRYFYQTEHAQRSNDRGAEMCHQSMFYGSSSTLSGTVRLWTVLQHAKRLLVFELFDHLLNKERGRFYLILLNAYYNAINRRVPLHEKISISSMSKNKCKTKKHGLFQYFNFGDDTCTTILLISARLTSMHLGCFTLSAYVDNGTRFLEGEKRGYNGLSTSLQGAYL